MTGATGSKLQFDIDTKMDGFVSLCAVLGKLQKISLANCGLGPASAAELAKAVSDAEAALARVSVLSNPIGIDGADALIEVFEQNTNLRTLLGIEEGITEVNLSKKNVDRPMA